METEECKYYLKFKGYALNGKKAGITANYSEPIDELAKILKGKGVNIGQNRLFKWMRDKGYLINRRGSDRNVPTQKSMEMGLFQIKETVINHPDGKPSIRKTPKVTGKGQQYFVDKFVAQNEAMEA